MASRFVCVLLLLVPVAGEVLLSQTKTCPSSSVYCGNTKDAAGAPIWNQEVLTPPGQCENVAMVLPEDGMFKLCGPGKWSVWRMSCDNHDYKPVEVVHPTDQYTEGKCKVYETKNYYQIHKYIGSVTFNCDATAR